MTRLTFSRRKAKIPASHIKLLSIYIFPIAQNRKSSCKCPGNNPRCRQRGIISIKKANPSIIDIKIIMDGFLNSGPGGNRTRVQTGIPCTSTIIVHSLTFPPPDGNEHPAGFSSFMIRPYTQSLIYVVSYIIDAWILRCRCPKSDSSH